MKKVLILLLAMMLSSLTMAQTFRYRDGSPQQVHERRFVVYAESGENLVLDIHPDDKWMYARWYDKNTDRNPRYVTGFVTGTSYQSQYQLFPDGGYIAFGGLDNQPSKTPSSAIYNRTYYGISSGVLDEIVVDLSKYKDYQNSLGTSGIFYEPTLSVRYIFEIHPAAEKALPPRSAALTNTEIYGYNTASTEVRLCTDRPFIGNNADYYYTEGGTIYKMTDPSKFELWKKVNTSPLAVCSASEYRFDTDGQTIIINAPNVSDDVWYKLFYKPGTTYGGDYYGYYYEVAQFSKVVSFNPSGFGPKNATNGTIVAEADMRELYGKPLAHISFDDYPMGNALPLVPESGKIYLKTAYGHYESGTKRTNSNYTSALNNIQTGEYVIGTSRPDNSFEVPQYNDVEFKQAMFVSGSSFKQNILEFVVPANICSGTKTYWTVWVMGEANLNIEIQPMQNGVLRGAGPRVINTGDVTRNNGHWQQIKFSINDNVIFNEFKVRIYNNNDASTNFAIGDINVYALPNPVEAYTVPVDCHHSVAAIAKFNYHGAPTANFYYYTWLGEDEDGNLSQLDLNYCSNQGNCGRIHNSELYMTESDIPSNKKYTSVEDMITRTSIEEAARPNAFEDSFYLGYIVENCIDYNYADEGRFDSKPVLYIIHYNNKMKDKEQYTVQFAATTNFANAGCNYMADITPRYNAEIITTRDIECAYEQYSYEPQFYQAQYDANGKIKDELLKVNCLNDVVIGKLTAAELSAIRTALNNFRNEYPECIKSNPLDGATIPNTITPKGNLTQAEADLLNALKDEQRIKFNSELYRNVFPYGDTIVTTFFPITSTAYYIDSTDGFNRKTSVADFCAEPIEFTFDATTLSGLTWGSRENPLPVALTYKDNTYRKRMYNDEPIVLPVKAVSDGFTINRYRLVETNDKSLLYDMNYYTAIDVFVFLITNSPSQAGSNVTFNVDTIATNDKFTGFKEGYFYRFEHEEIQYAAPAEPTAQEGMSKSMEVTSCNPAQAFVLYITPFIATYIGSDNNWHNDKNWVTTDEKGVPRADGLGYVPGNRTGAIIQANRRVVLPEVEPCTTSSCDRSQWGIDGFTKYQDGFVPNTCDSIYVQPYAQMGNQQYLNYTKAFVDVATPKEKWSLLGFTLNDVVSGDMFAEQTDNDNPFAVPTLEHGNNVLIWQKIYNNTMENMTWDGVTNITSTTWTAPANTVKHRYQPGTAVMVWPYDNTNGTLTKDNVMVFRLPKTDTEYYYFNRKTGNKSNVKENVPLLPGASGRLARLAFEPQPKTDGMNITLTNGNSSNLFTFANPTLDSINIEEFLKANQTVLDVNTFDEIDGNSIQPTITQKTTLGTRNNTGGSTKKWLLPGEGIMLHALNASTSISVKLPVSALKAQMNTTTVQSSSAIGDASTLYIKSVCNGQTSYASIYTDVNADNEYRANEDAELFFIDKSTTPAAVYTVAGNKALVINGMSTFSSVPMAIYTIDSTINKATVTFTGVDSFDGDISLLDITDGSLTLIAEGDVLTLATTAKNENVRYFLQKSAHTTTDTELVDNNDAIDIFVANDGTIQIVANEELMNVIVYGAAGQEVMHDEVNSRYMSYSLPAGVYVVKAYTQHNHVVRKVIVK